MATKHIVQLVDDLDGSDIEPGMGETIRFGLDGMSYEIDLGNGNAEALRDILAPFVASARQRSSRDVPITRVRTDADPTAVRAWAAANGIKVSPRGRIAADVVAQFEAAGN